MAMQQVQGITQVGGICIQPLHRASCHCGRVQLELRLPDGLIDPRRCDCSYCRRRGTLVASVALAIMVSNDMILPIFLRQKLLTRPSQRDDFAKTLLHAAPGDKDVFGAVVGDPLEIVLVTNPADITAGGTIACRVLRDGKPLATEVKAGYDGFSAKEDEYAVQTTSDSAGLAQFVVPKAGLWFIRVAVTEKLSGADADKVNLRATYAFEVK